MGYVLDLRKKIGHQTIISVGSAAVVIRAKKILLVYRLDNHLWGLPAGSKELNESLEKTAIRELQEETGLIGSSPKLLTILSGEGMQYKYPNGDQIDSVTAIYSLQASGELTSSDETMMGKYFDCTSLPENMTPITKQILKRLDLNN